MINLILLKRGPYVVYTNLICPLTGHKEGSKAFNRYRKIDEDTNRKTVSLLE